MVKLHPIFLLFMLTFSSTAFAEREDVKYDKFNLRLGTYFIGNTETELRYDTDKLLGTTLNSSRDLGMNDSLQTFRVDGYYRFNKQHSVDFAWYHIGRNGGRIIDHEVDWGDITYVSGRLDSKYNTDIYKVSYGWSFHHDEKVELALLAGLHITEIELSLKGQVDMGGGLIAGKSTSTSITAPLPVVGFKLNYNITPRWLWSNKLELFHMSFDVYDGSFVDIASTIEYRPFKNVGFGTGFNGSALTLEKEDGDNTLSANGNIGGWLAYMSLYF